MGKEVLLNSLFTQEGRWPKRFMTMKDVRKADAG